MKREQLIAYGIPADKIKEFMGEYWKDVAKQAQHKAKSQPDPVRDTRQAIATMVGLIDDPKRLQMILKCINRHYNDYTQEQPQTAAKGAVEEC